MQLIVGLGNVGPEYAATRHNVGFLVLETLAQRHGIRMATKQRAGGRTVACSGDGTIGGRDVRLLLPQTMMNVSGDSLTQLESWGVRPRDLLIVCDDVNLPLGALRLRPQGGAGGHNGLASCLERLGTQQVARLRIGVASDPLPKDLTEFVVSAFRPAERPVIRRATELAADACAGWVTDGIQATMNRVNATS